MKKLIEMIIMKIIQRNSKPKNEIFFALGKAYEDLKDFENSFSF